ncbi:hypothetical protein Patl1_23921 [Pistacia atlantica]|uniref:Uncharacterized protein n=1 Tax=Pistacia atlantica TaxID=434234 RepID=A0ACC0ZZC1_9ROSI|nr:hypothetical protein Patl1_23921 [Pistacia atlantica]
MFDSSLEEIMLEISRREKQAGIVPDPDIDTYMKVNKSFPAMSFFPPVNVLCYSSIVISQRTKRKPRKTDYITKILGLYICTDSLVGDALRRGIYGVKKKVNNGVPERKSIADFLRKVKCFAPPFSLPLILDFSTSPHDRLFSCRISLKGYIEHILCRDSAIVAAEFIMFFAVHVASLSMFLFMGSLSITPIAIASACVVLLLLMQHRNHDLKMWGFWVSPMTYGQIGLSVNDFLAPRWQNVLSKNMTTGREILSIWGQNFEGFIFWVSLGALIGFTLVFKLHQYLMALPCEPLTNTFQDVQYYINTPSAMRKHGCAQKKLQILSDITGAVRPGVLTALMGVSGAGKTTLLDVLAGRKTSGYIKGEIKINYYPKVQETFARISGYCEQNDVHSPQITIEESLLFLYGCVWLLRLTRKLKLVSGLSVEQRKWLTIAMELVANPSIIFMDEPTTVDSFEIWWAHNLLGPLGKHSSKVIEYFEGIPGLSKIRDNYNPATWMLEVTSATAEVALGVDFAKMHRKSALYDILEQQCNGKTLEYSPSWFKRSAVSIILHAKWLETIQILPVEAKLSYWRSPSYNLTRLLHTFVASLIFGVVYCNQGQELNNQQNIFNILGSMCGTVIFFGASNCLSVSPYVTTERTVSNRERFAGMYSPWTYALAQHIPRWWVWFYYLMPTSWTINGMLTSQYGDTDENSCIQQVKKVAAFLKDYFGFHHDHLALSAVALAIYPIAFALLFAYFVRRLNFQHR